VIEPFAPPAVYAQWWAEMEVCSGRTRGDRAVRWYRVETDTGLVIPGLGDRALGFWRPGVIYLAAPAVGWRATVAHEMLHELLRDGSHASPLFETCFTP
jgi:hypothetical protein